MHFSLLLLCCYCGLLGFGIVPVSTQPNPDKNPLHHYAARGDVKMVEELLKNGADPNEGVGWSGNLNDGATPLHLAISQGKVDVVKVLLEPQWKVDLTKRRTDGWNCVHYAASRGSLEIMEMLLDAGAPVDEIMNSQALATPLHFATRKSFAPIVKILLEHGADPNRMKDGFFTPMHDSTLQMDYEITAMLLEKGGNPLAVNDGETTPWHIAAFKGDRKTLQLFLDHGVPVNSRRNERNTALHDAAGVGDLQTMRMLISNGALLNAVNEQNMNVLICSVHIGQVEAVKWLVENGANQVPEAKTLALSFNDEDLIEYFTQLDRKPQSEWTPEDVMFWLSLIDLPHKRQLVWDNQIDGNALLALDAPKLLEYGFDQGEADLILNERFKRTFVGNAVYQFREFTTELLGSIKAKIQHRIG